MRNNRGLLLFLAFNHAALVWGLLRFPMASLLVSLPFMFLLTCFGASLGYHRLLAHRSYEAPVWAERILSLLGCLTLAGPPILWVGIHRLHHRHSDQPGDPHSPRLIGWLRVFLYDISDFRVPRALARDLVDDPFQRFLYRYYLRLILGLYVFVYLISPWAGIFMLSVPALWAHYSFAFTNIGTHLETIGRNDFRREDSSKNNRWLGIFMWGEGWHNNHHQNPSSYHNGVRPGQFDFGAWILEHSPLMKNRHEIRAARLARMEAAASSPAPAETSRNAKPSESAG